MSSSAPNISVLQVSSSTPSLPVPPNPYGDTRKNGPATNSMSSPKTNGDMNLKDRDPFKTNQHLRIVFTDVISEPEPRVYSFDRVWVLSHQAFAVTKLWTYRILTILFAIPCAVFWALTFGIISFFYIWCCAPCLKAFHIQFRFVRELMDITAQTFVTPLMNAMGRCLSHVRFTWTRKYVDDDDDESHDDEAKFEDVHLA